MAALRNWYNISPCASLGDVCFPSLKQRLHGFKRSWSPKRHTFPRRQDRGPTESKLWFPPGHWRLPAPRHLGRVIAMLARLGDPDHRKEVGLLLHNEGRKEHVWHPVNPCRSLLVLPCPDLMANGHMQQPCPEKGRMKGGSGPSGMQVLVMPLRPEGSGWEQYRRGKMSICCSPKTSCSSRGYGLSPYHASSRLSPQEGSPSESWRRCFWSWL